MKSFTLSELNRQSGEVVDAAMAGPVSLTKRGKPKLVMMPASTYDLIRHGRTFRIDDAPEALNRLLIEGLEDMLSDQ